MRARWTAVSLGLLALSTPLAGQNPVFRSSADSVLVDVFVRTDGQPIEGLAADAFDVRDNGVAQTITSAAYERAPISVTLVVQIGANAAATTRLEGALAHVVTALHPDDRAALVTFGRRITQVTGALTGPVKLERPADAGPPEPASPVGRGGPGGRIGGAPMARGGLVGPAGPRPGDAMTDALAVALATGPGAGRRQLVILAWSGDGRDTASFLDRGSVNELGWRTDAIVDRLVASDRVVAQPRPVIGSPIDPSRFDPILVATGGRFIPVGPADDMGAALARAIDEVRASYVLSYAPRGVKREGWHEITVTLKKGKGEVRARQGYFGG